jgi:hypothetical protein
VLVAQTLAEVLMVMRVWALNHFSKRSEFIYLALLAETDHVISVGVAGFHLHRYCVETKPD